MRSWKRGRSNASACRRSASGSKSSAPRLEADDRRHQGLRRLRLQKRPVGGSAAPGGTTVSSAPPAPYAITGRPKPSPRGGRCRSPPAGEKGAPGTRPGDRPPRHRPASRGTRTVGPASARRRRSSGPVPDHEQAAAEPVRRLHREVHPLVGRERRDDEIVVARLVLHAEAGHVHRRMDHVGGAPVGAGDAFGDELRDGDEVVDPSRRPAVPAPEPRGHGPASRSGRAHPPARPK